MAVLLAPQDSVNMAQAQWQEMFAGLFSNGVMASQLNTYTVTTTGGLGISVASGRAMIQGFMARSDAAVALTCATADPTNPRIDRAVLHADLTAHTLTVQLLTGTPAGSPSPPALTQTATVWEISVYQIRVNALQTVLTAGSLTDERTYSLANIPTASLLDAMMANQKVNRTGDTMTGSLTNSAAEAFITSATNAGIEHGSVSSPNQPFFDWHSSGNNIDYDARLQASGGTASIGQGALSLHAAGGWSTDGPYSSVGGQGSVGAFGVPVIVAQALDTHITTTTLTNVLTYTPSSNQKLRINCTFAANNGGTNQPTLLVAFTGSSYSVAEQLGMCLNTGLQLNGGNTVTAQLDWNPNTVTISVLSGVAVICKYQNSTGTPNDFCTYIIERLA